MLFLGALMVSASLVMYVAGRIVSLYIKIHLILSLYHFISISYLAIYSVTMHKFGGCVQAP